MHEINSMVDQDDVGAMMKKQNKTRKQKNKSIQENAGEYTK